jgi:hypothetical protein
VLHNACRTTISYDHEYGDPHNAQEYAAPLDQSRTVAYRLLHLLPGGTCRVPRWREVPLRHDYCQDDAKGQIKDATHGDRQVEAHTPRAALRAIPGNVASQPI